MKTDKKYSKGKKEKNKNSDDEEWLPHKKEKSRKNKTSKTSNASKEIKKRKAEEQKEQEGQNRKIRTGDPMMDDIVTTYIIDTVSELFDEKRKAVISLEEWKRLEEEQLRINREMEKEIEANSYGPKIWTVRERKFITLKFDKVFTSLEELISLGETFDPSVIYVSVINMLKLKSVLENIKYLSSLIGLKSFKDSVLKQLLYILTLPQITDNDFPMLHGCIYGPPGVGKTEIAKTLGNIYSSCGLLKKNIFKIAKREDFVGEFVGSTSIKTRKLLESCIGGVLLIDEVYSFGSEDSREIFSLKKLLIV